MGSEMCIRDRLVFWGLFTVIVPKIAVGVPFGPELLAFSTRDLLTAFWAAVIGLGLNEGAYLAEIFRSGLNSVDPARPRPPRPSGWATAGSCAASSCRRPCG